jgi:hypothetical protein
MPAYPPLPPPPAEPRPGRYRHYKGNLYEVLGLVHHSEDQSVLVLYRSLDVAGRPRDGVQWVRPHRMWSELVEVDGRQVERFARVPDQA